MLRSFANLKLIHKLLVPVSFFVATLGVTLWTAHSGFLKLYEVTDAIVDETVVRQELLLRSIGDINEASLLEKNILLSSDRAEMAAYNERCER